MPRTSKPVTHLQRWTDAVQSISPDDLRASVPIHVLLGEAADVAAFHANHWKALPASPGVAPRPGLESVASADRGLTKDTGNDILSLAAAVHEARVAYRKCLSPKGAAPIERAQLLIDEMLSALEWHFDDGVEDEKDAQLAAVRSEHAADPDSVDALATELDDVASLAAEHRSDLDGLGGFDPAVIDEAAGIVTELRSRSATPLATSPEAKQALSLRNRLLVLLSRRIQTVRAAARFVFRHHPDLVRQATSAYERRRRTAQRRSSKKKQPA